MHHQHAKSQAFFPMIYDVISADYEISLNCRFSHATTHKYIFYSVDNLRNDTYWGYLIYRSTLRLSIIVNFKIICARKFK